MTHTIRAFQGLPAVPLAVKRRWCILLSAWALAGGAACTDGYPTQDAPVVDPSKMTQPQRLAKMNALGDDAHSEHQWTYALLPGCVLSVHLDGATGPRPAVHVPLMGAAVKVSADRASDAFNVDIFPSAPADHDEVTVLQATQWADAVGMARVLRFVEMGCSHDK